MNDEFWSSPKRNLIFLSRLHQSTNAPICPQRRQEFHIWVWNVRRGCHYDGCFCLTFYLNNSLTLLELLTQTIITPWWDSLGIFFPQEVCHKRTRLTPTRLTKSHRHNSIKVIESLNESTKLASKVFLNILMIHGIHQDIFGRKCAKKEPMDT